MNPKTTDDIEAMNAEQRLAFVNLINARINASESVSDDDINLALYACRFERARSAGNSRKSAAKANTPVFTEDDL